MTARPGAGRRALLAAATARLAAAGVASPGHDAAELLAHVLGTTRGRLVLVDEVDPGRVAAYDELVTRRAAREPLQHLTGLAHFRHVELRVGPGVFVPRPETELLAGWAIEEAGRVLAAGRAPVVVDLCTGSGAIARALVDEVPGAVVHAVELDEAAHRWAERNLAGTGTDLRHGDMATAFDDLAGTVDVVTCNPPYIPLEAWESVAPEARDHDPHLALFSGTTASTRCACSPRVPRCCCGPGESWAPSTPTSRATPHRRSSARRAAGPRCATTATWPGPIPDRRSSTSRATRRHEGDR